MNRAQQVQSRIIRILQCYPHIFQSIDAQQVELSCQVLAVFKKKPEIMMVFETDGKYVSSRDLDDQYPQLKSEAQLGTTGVQVFLQQFIYGKVQILLAMFP